MSYIFGSVLHCHLPKYTAVLSPIDLWFQVLERKDLTNEKASVDQLSSVICYELAFRSSMYSR